MAFDETTTIEVVKNSSRIEEKSDNTEISVFVANTEVEFRDATAAVDVGTTEVKFNWTKGVDEAEKFAFELVNRTGKVDLETDNVDVGESISIKVVTTNVDDVALPTAGGVDANETKDETL